MRKLIERIDGAIDGAGTGSRAEAVLTALREPTQAMLAAAANSRSGSGLGIWQAMIDAALADGEPVDEAGSGDWVVTASRVRDPGLADDAAAMWTAHDR